jgi:hypothetical protein
MSNRAARLKTADFWGDFSGFWYEGLPGGKVLVAVK